MLRRRALLLAPPALLVARPAAAEPVREWRVGRPIPDFGFRDAGGRRRTVSQSAGQVRLILFWGSWCGPCQHELPRIDALTRRWKDDRRVEVIALSVNEPLARSRAYLERKNYALPAYEPDRVDGWTVKLADGSPAFIGGTPTGLVLDPGGALRVREAGSGKAASYEAEIARLLSLMIRVA